MNGWHSLRRGKGKRSSRRGGVRLVLLAIWLIGALALPVQPSRAQDTGGWRCAVVTGTGTLNIRDTPGLDGAVVGTLASGTELEANYDQTITASGYNWVPVRFAGEQGRTQGWAITPRLGPCANGVTGDDELVLDGVNQDGALDRYEIAEVGRSVVLVANVWRGRVLATGTGTIITPDGLILTNAHVIDGAEEIAIGILNDLNDPAQLTYKAELIGVDAFIDVALLAIRSDLDDQPINAADLNLPYLPASLRADEVFRGDPIYIFGYPGIGDDFLVVTQGTVVSVENGDINGQRIPVWYRTDAEIAPGSSGGLVVNGNGEFIGIPTVVRAEEETGARLGGIRPAEVAVLAVLDEEAADSATPSTGPDTAAANVSAGLMALNLEHSADEDGTPGLRLHIDFSLTGWAEQPALLFARVYEDTIASPPLTNPTAPPEYRDDDGTVWATQPLTPCCTEAVFRDEALFLPYAALGITATGQYPLKLQVGVMATDGSWSRTLSWEFIIYARG